MVVPLVMVFFSNLGSKNAKVTKAGHDKSVMYAKGRHYSRNDCERLVRKLVIDGILTEQLYVTAMDTAVCYVKLGKFARNILDGSKKVSSLTPSLNMWWF